jgi:hypothetical protein
MRREGMMSSFAGDFKPRVERLQATLAKEPSAAPTPLGGSNALFVRLGTGVL